MVECFLVICEQVSNLYIRFLLTVTMTSDIPVHCQLREVIRKMQQCQHSLNRIFAAVHTWVIEGDHSSIDNECASIKTSAIAAMEMICADLHYNLHLSRDQLQRFVYIPFGRQIDFITQIAKGRLIW